MDSYGVDAYSNSYGEELNMTRPKVLKTALQLSVMTRASFMLLLGLSLSLQCVLSSKVYAQSSSIAIVDDRSVHVPYEYEVEDGDTLWLISQEFFNDPWLWPNLWALNPHITNPHWIYPGDIIRLKWTEKAAAESQGEDFELEPVAYSTDLQNTADLV